MNITPSEIVALVNNLWQVERVERAAVFHGLHAENEGVREQTELQDGLSNEAIILEELVEIQRDKGSWVALSLYLSRSESSSRSLLL